MYINNLNELRQHIHTLKANDILYYSSDLNYFNGIKLAIKRGADIHLNNEQVLRNACFDSNIKLIKFLIENGSDIHYDDDYVMFYALKNKNNNLIIFLLNHGLDINITIQKHDSQIIKKIFNNIIEKNINLIEILLKYNLNIKLLNEICNIDILYLLRKYKLEKIKL